jgi:hypothetical protein
MLDSYISKVIVTLVSAGCGVVGIAGGYYTTYLIVTMIGAS